MKLIIFLFQQVDVTICSLFKSVSTSVTGSTPSIPIISPILKRELFFFPPFQAGNCYQDINPLTFFNKDPIEICRHGYFSKERDRQTAVLWAPIESE